MHLHLQSKKIWFLLQGDIVTFRWLYFWKKRFAQKGSPSTGNFSTSEAGWEDCKIPSKNRVLFGNVCSMRKITFFKLKKTGMVKIERSCVNWSLKSELSFFQTYKECTCFIILLQPSCQTHRCVTFLSSFLYENNGHWSVIRTNTSHLQIEMPMKVDLIPKAWISWTGNSWKMVTMTDLRSIFFPLLVTSLRTWPFFPLQRS